MPPLTRGWALRAGDLWWVLASPVYLVLGTLRHEGSHLLVGLAQGGRIGAFSILPSDRGWGFVQMQGGQISWLTFAAPYLGDALVFAAGYVWAFRIAPTRRWLFVNVFVVMMLSPLINTANNSVGGLASSGSDFFWLGRQFGAVAVTVASGLAIASYSYGILRVLTRSPMACTSASRAEPRS